MKVCIGYVIFPSNILNASIYTIRFYGCSFRKQLFMIFIPTPVIHNNPCHCTRSSIGGCARAEVRQMSLVVCKLTPVAEVSKDSIIVLSGSRPGRQLARYRVRWRRRPIKWGRKEPFC